MRVLSWIVLYLISYLVSLLTSLIVSVGAWLLTEISQFNAFLRVLIYFFGGATFIGILFAPAYYGVVLSIMASEAVKKSKKGTRYRVFSIYMLVTSIIYIIIGFSRDTFHLNSLIMCFYYVVMLIASKEFSGQSAENVIL